MSKKPGKQDSLRMTAEAQFGRHAPEMAASARSAEELLHELQVHQIELEMQNDALRESQIELEKSRDRYLDMYEFAPVGYLTLTRDALIAEINLTGAALLGEARSKLLRRRFAAFVAPEERDRWHQVFMRTVQYDDKQSCGLVLQRGDGSRFHAQLDSVHLVKEGEVPMVRLAFTDITERKEADERYRKLFEEASDAIMLADAKTGEILELNQALADMVGRDKTELIGKPQNILFPPETGTPEFNMLWQQRLDMRSKEFETQFLTKDGDVREVAIKASVMTLTGREVAFGIIRSTTERNQARAGERRLRNILDNTLDMIFIFSPDTLRFVYANKGAIKGIGYSLKEILQMSPQDVMLQIPEPESRAFIAPLISGNKKMRRFETMVRRKDGRDFPVEVQLQLVREQGDSGLFVAIVRDIAKRKFAEKELRQQKNLMWRVIDMDPNMIFVKDKAGKFLLANQAVADFYGLTIQKLIGKNNSELNSNPQEVSGFLAADREAIESRREVILTESLMKDGNEHWYHTIKRPLSQDDGSTHVLGIAVDISELKISGIKLAESYKELQKLALHLENIRAEERALIARNLHDEMGATLAALKMRIAWLASKLPSGMPHLLNEAAHISDLVSDGIMTLRQVVTDLRPNLLDDVGLAAAVGDYLKKFQRDTEIECILVLPEEEIAMSGDQSVTVFRIIQESLNNVAKHAQASKVEILLERHGESLQLLIKDNGVGFDTTRKKQSFGLLGIKERALMIGGAAMIASTPGYGTVVSLSILSIPPPSHNMPSDSNDS